MYLRERTDFQSKIQMACQAIMQSRFHLSIAKSLTSSTFTQQGKVYIRTVRLYLFFSFGNGGSLEETLNSINSHHTANLNFPAKELRVRLWFWFL